MECAHCPHPQPQRDGRAAVAKRALLEGPSAEGHSGSSGEGTVHSL